MGDGECRTGVPGCSWEVEWGVGGDRKSLGGVEGFSGEEGASVEGWEVVSWVEWNGWD